MKSRVEERVSLVYDFYIIIYTEWIASMHG
jgi:hypothetical protein